MSTVLQRFMALFAGSDRGYGTYEVKRVSARGKHEGSAVTHKGHVTPDHYERHLNKQVGFGVVPIRDDSTCVFAALDVDDYTNKYVSLVESVKANNLPLVPTLSKSGGLHLWLFFKEPVPCDVVRKKLSELSDALGVSGCEVFPKQDVINGTDEVGNWINLPYFGGALGPQESERLFVDPRSGDKVAELEVFLKVAEALRITQDQLEALSPGKRTDAPIKDGPPCLQKLAIAKVTEGGRNNAMFQFGVYLREKHSKDAGYSDMALIQHMRDTNDRYFDPPLPDEELITIAKSVYKDKHFYKCNDQPMQPLCNRAVCLRRRYGIGDPNASADQRLEFGHMQKFIVIDHSGQPVDDEMPWYHWTINGRILKFSLDEISNVEDFRQRCFAQLDCYPQPMKKNDWEQFLNEVIKAADKVHVPFESGAKGQLIGHVLDFVRDFSQRGTWDAILEGDVYVDREECRAYFKWQDLNRYFDRKNVRGFKPNDVWDALKRYLDGRNGETTLYGKHVRYWSIKLQERDLQAPTEVAPEF